MALSHDSFTFFSAGHSLIVPEGPFELRLLVGSYFGVIGESHIQGETGGRELACKLTLQDYASRSLLEADLRTLDSKAGQLTGDLTETIGGNTRTFPQCTFLGWAPQEEPFYDGSGAHGWVQRVRLMWRQRKRYTT